MIHDFIATLDHQLQVPPRTRRRILTEVRDHLDDAVASLQSSGMELGPAHEQAVHAFGSAEDLAQQLNAQAATTAMRHLPMVIVVGTTFVVGGFLLAALTQPQPKMPANASVVTQVSFFVAVLGLQVALVAGARAASLVAARWRTSLAPVGDRRLVHRASMVCAGGLGVAAAGWMLAVLSTVLPAGAPGHARLASALAGVGVMGAAAIAVAWRVSHRSVREDGIAVSEPEAVAGLLALGEHVVRAIRRRPAVSCAAVAAIAALSAMWHAETTVVGALPWGGAEVVTVVAGYLLLGRQLGLRCATESTPSLGRS